MTTSSNMPELAETLARLIESDPVVHGDGEDRLLSSLTSDAHGWCGYVEEIVTTHLEAHGFDARPGEFGSPTVVWFGLHYVTLIELDQTYVLDFTPSQIPGFETWSHTPPYLLRTLAEYIDETGLTRHPEDNTPKGA